MNKKDTNKKKNIELNKMRSYASVFSRQYFTELLKFDDYSFIDENILQYDSTKVGVGFTTYFDYIKYIYSKLRRQYRNEYVYKNTFIEELLIKSYGVKNTIAINEFRVGNSIADIVMFNGTSKAFEIKTELDTSKRLSGQLKDYSKIFNQCYIVTHETLVDKYLEEDESIGVIELVEGRKSLKMREVRPAKKNIEIDSNTLIQSIRKNEYINIVNQYFEVLPEMNSFNMFDICSQLMEKIEHEDLNSLFIEQMKKRKSNTIIIESFVKELRQIGLSMNMDCRTYGLLFDKLNKPIQI